MQRVYRVKVYSLFCFNIYGIGVKSHKVRMPVIWALGCFDICIMYGKRDVCEKKCKVMRANGYGGGLADLSFRL